MGSEQSVERTAGQVVVRGEIDPTGSAALVEGALAAVGERGDGPVELDLRSVDFIDSSGLGALIRIQRTCTEQGVPLVLRPSAAVDRLLELCDLVDLFDLRRDEGPVG